MAFLMLLCEKMRLQRQISSLSLKQMQMGNKVSRMQKKVKKRQDYYAKLEKQIDRQATNYVNLANNSIFSNGMGGWNPGSVLATGQVGYSPMQQQAIQQAIAQVKCNDSNGITAEQVQLFMMSPMSFQTKYKQEDGKSTGEIEGYTVQGQPLSQDQMTAIQQAAQYARYIESQYGQMQTACKTQYQQQINDWQQAMHDQLDMQKECELDMLEEEQSDMEQEEESIKVQIEYAEARKKEIENRLGQAVQDSAPKFGLG